MLQLLRKISPVRAIAFSLIIAVSIIPLRLAIALQQAPKPEAILVLGSDSNRMQFAAEFSQLHPALEILVSDYPSYFEDSQKVFQEAGIPDWRIRYDFCATDTVTNFTCTVEEFVKRKLHHVYLITSDYHMPRARAIATIVFGSRGIFVTPLTVASSGKQPESLVRIIRDSLRSVIWIVSGRTGASFNPHLVSVEPQVALTIRTRQ
jgi:uncharacterized SAM-binding protein YcdF (DUF218 family)